MTTELEVPTDITDCIDSGHPLGPSRADLFTKLLEPLQGFTITRIALLGVLGHPFGPTLADLRAELLQAGQRQLGLSSFDVGERFNLVDRTGRYEASRNAPWTTISIVSPVSSTRVTIVSACS